MRVAACQIAPVLLDRDAGVAKVVEWIDRAADDGAKLAVFGETLLPGYPAWLDRTDGARFNSDLQKHIHARYLDQAVSIEDGHLEPICAIAKKRGVAVVVSVAERPRDRAGQTLYCSCVHINADGSIGSVQRKLMPTYEERLCWGIGDGHGLVTHRVGEFVVGSLNCWENWMPLARAALYAGGETLHVAIWPGCVRNTVDITRMIALESRSFVVSVSGLLRASDIPDDFPERDLFIDGRDIINDGGSCIASPDGAWLVEPAGDGNETMIVADLDPARVREERQNFDPSGHYARPDVLRLVVDRRRQAAAEFLDDDGVKG